MQCFHDAAQIYEQGGFQKAPSTETLLWTAGGLAAAWLLAWYAVPGWFPCRKGCSIRKSGAPWSWTGTAAESPHCRGPDYYHTEPVRLRRFRTCFLRLRWRRKTNAFSATGRGGFPGAGPRRGECRRREVVSGASTITQQLAKNANPPARRNLWTKAREPEPGACGDERGGNCRSISTSWITAICAGGPPRRRVSTLAGEMSRLSLAECALLAGLPQGPSFLNPSGIRNVRWNGGTAFCGVWRRKACSRRTW